MKILLQWYSYSYLSAMIISMALMQIWSSNIANTLGLLHYWAKPSVSSTQFLCFQVTHTIHHVTYNSYYWIELRRYDDVTTGRRMVFQTPVCENVDASSTHCYPVTTKVSSPVVTTPNTVSIDPNQEFKLKWAERKFICKSNQHFFEGNYCKIMNTWDPIQYKDAILPV